MYHIAMDQNRQDNIPAQHTLQVHMHHLCCPCSNVIYPYYPPSYRPPILSQPAPIARPSYLHHYQYTQLHVNPTYNVPLPLTQSINHSPPSTADLAFGPPPRDRRNLDVQEFEEQWNSEKNKTDNRDCSLQYTPIPNDNKLPGASLPSSNEKFINITASQVDALSTEDYISYLVNGCLTGERIAKRNEHRPCFKNIQNLCNRTRSEVVKPNITVSNIHSQGVPWATKDFIFAFVRAVNCWCILRGYLGCTDGNLGKIDKEISSEFRACYNKWEKCTKQLTHYLIQTFCKLDEVNTPNGSVTPSTTFQQNSFTTTSASPVNLLIRAKSPSPSQDSTKPTQMVLEPLSSSSEQTFPNKEMASLKGIPGILHIPSATSNELTEVRNPTTESTEYTPRDDDSEHESRVYMKPGSYNVPKKQSSTNSPRSVEFFETAQNVPGYQKKITTDKLDFYTSDLLKDKVWQAAQNVTPDFIKQTEEATPGVSSNSIDKIFDIISIPQHNKRIENWLNNEKNRFDCRNLDVEEENLHLGDDGLTSFFSGKLRINEQTNLRCGTSNSSESEAYRHLRKRMETGEVRLLQKSYNAYNRGSNSLEYKSGGLTDSSLYLVDRIIKELETHDFASYLRMITTCNNSNGCDYKNPTNLHTIQEKLNLNKYVCINEVVHDIRHICHWTNENCADAPILILLEQFRKKTDEIIYQAFPHLDFKHITGEPNEIIETLMKKSGKSRKSAEGDGDH